jgi:cytochrome oxidase assembly protein ShyY1
MYRFLRAPRWIAALLFVATVVVVFIALGNWQLSRHREVMLDNQIYSTRISAEPTDLADMLTAAGPSIDSLEYRRAAVEGAFDPADEVLVRNQVNNGVAGFHVVTPFRFGDATILVNRGWVPLALDTPPVDGAPPPEGTVDVELLLRASQPIPAIGQIEPEGELDVINRIDLERLSRQFGHLAPVWGQLVAPADPERYPIVLEMPTFDDNGPHLAYAVQWYLFALTTVVGSAFLIRSTARKTARRKTEG